MRQGDEYNYEIVKTNHRGASLVVEVVRGQSFGASRAEHHNSRLTAEEREDGWSVYAQRTTASVTYKPMPRRPMKRDRGK